MNRNKQKKINKNEQKWTEEKEIEQKNRNEQKELEIKEL